jgi:hypothetical protein
MPLTRTYVGCMLKRSKNSPARSGFAVIGA